MLNVIFDATLITNVFKKDQARSGIFFVALNLLRELDNRADVNVSLYFSPDYYAEAYRVKRDFLPDLDYVQNLCCYPLLCLANLKFWRLHGKFFHHRYLRKPLALGIVVTQRILRLLGKNKVYEDKLQRCDVYLSPAYCIPSLIRRYEKIRPFIVLHDTIPFKFPSYCSGDWSCYLRNIMSMSKEGDHFFCVSRSTQNDFKKIFPLLNDDNSSVITLAANERFRNCKSNCDFNSIKEKYGIPTQKKYVFSLCTLEPRKNLVRAIRSFVLFCKKNDIQDLVWVLGGGHWESFIQVLNKEIENLNDFSNLIVRAGYVDDEDLPVLYSNAEWFVYTSQYEGFGLPPLEAMQCGCPVIVSNNSSLPEVVGDAGILIDWDSDEQHVAAYEKYYFDKGFRDMKATEGLKRAKLFSWEKTVDEIVKYMGRTVK